MKRCRSDELREPEDEPGGAGEPLGAAAMEAKGGEAAAPEVVGGPAPRAKPPDLKKIQQLSEGSMFGHGLKHLFHSRRRSREREHQNSQDSLPPHYGLSDHDSPDEKERSPEMHRVSYAVSLHDLPARPTAFNRVLQQIRSRPSIKRGTSLHSGSRRAKSGSLEPQKGSPHLVRKAPQDSSLTAILHQHQGRPRSSSTTDTAILLAESGAVYLLTEDTESLADKVTAVLLTVKQLLDLLITQRGVTVQKLLRGAGAQPRVPACRWISRMKFMLGSSPSTQSLLLTVTAGHPESLRPQPGRIQVWTDIKDASLVIRREGMGISKAAFRAGYFKGAGMGERRVKGGAIFVDKIAWWGCSCPALAQQRIALCRAEPANGCPPPPAVIFKPRRA